MSADRKAVRGQLADKSGQLGRVSHFHTAKEVPTTPARPRRTAIRAAVSGTLSGLVFAAVIVGAWLMWNASVGSEHATDPSPAAPCPEDDRACNEWIDVQDPDAPTAAELITKHRCWTMRDGAPGNVDGLPGGVVIRVEGGPAEYTEDAMVIGAALDAALDGADNGIEAIAFCRGDS